MATRAPSLTTLARTNLGLAWQRSMLTCSDVLGLSGPLPDQILHNPPEYLALDRHSAEELRQGIYTLPGGRVELRTGAAPWRITPPNTVWAESLHGFAWIRHFAASDDPEIAEHLRWLITGWLSEKGRWDHIAWRPHVTARRLLSFLIHGKLFLDGADLIWRSSFLRSLARQSQHLYRTARWAPEGVPRLVSAVGLAVSGACLPGGERRLERGLALVEEQLDLQILPDGGHVTHNPQTLLALTIDLLVLRSALLQVDDGPNPEAIQRAIDRMMPMLRFFRHGDGRLALFNGSDEGPDGLVDTVLSEDETRGQPLRHARHSGFQRLARGRTLIIFDTGQPPERAFSSEAHAGCLSFEMSVGRHRLIVNCGATKTHGAEWREALRATAAHSTMTLADTSSCTFVAGNAIQGSALLRGPKTVTSERDEDDQGSWVNASHDGYLKDFGVTHARRLYVSARGDDVRGEDTLTRSKTVRGKTGEDPVTFAVRFHLHPDVRASLSQDETSVLLVLPNGDGWQFRAEGCTVELEESTYLGCGDKIRRSEQIVLSGPVERETTPITWVLKRMVKETEGAK